MMITVALYARVSSSHQVQTNTVESQISALENKIQLENHSLLEDHKFIDNGYSGANLVRPALERLRDKIAAGEIDKVYIHSPDRLSRKYAYQMILVEEFKKAGVEIVFLNYQTNESPESHLLLQMQGMIAEYEREKIMERNRRGKIYCAKKGSVNVLGGAPYGYCYVNKHMAGGQAFYSIDEEKAEIVRKIFLWIGQERRSIGDVRRQLKELNIPSPKGKNDWDRNTIWEIIKNPAYKGQAAFGKTKVGIKVHRIRPQKNSIEHPKDNYSVYRVKKEDWIYIPVPALVDDSLFEEAQEQLAENKKRSRVNTNKGQRYLLQGLIVCSLCQYAYYGKIAKNKRREKIQAYGYYRCTGTEGYRYGGNKVCNNKQIRTDALDLAVWEEVKTLLKDPGRVLKESQQRILALKNPPLDHTVDSLEKQENKLKRGISRLIDSYAQENIDKEEFEPRIKVMKHRLRDIEAQRTKIIDHKKVQNELTLMITNLENFASRLDSNLEALDRNTKQEVIRMLVKRVEIDAEDVNIVFRIKELPHSTPEEKLIKKDKSLQHCRESIISLTGGHCLNTA